MHGFCGLHLWMEEGAHGEGLWPIKPVCPQARHCKPFGDTATRASVVIVTCLQDRG